MDIGQPQQSLQRPLLDVYGLRLGMRHDVTRVGEPALLGDQYAVVPAVTEGPEVEPPQPARTFR